MATPVQVLKFKRYSDGSCEAMISFEKLVTVTIQKGHPPCPEGMTREAHEAEFFARIQSEVEADAKAAQADVSDVEGKTVAQLLQSVGG